MMKDNLTVEIPVEWLLILAIHGDMGEGDIPNIMQRWAKTELLTAGYQKEYSDRQKEKLLQVTQNLKNIIGEEKANKAIASIKDQVNIVHTAISAIAHET